jgi:hypothetical protein
LSRIPRTRAGPSTATSAENTAVGDVAPSWARYREPAEGEPKHRAIDRCKDRDACRRRVEATGATWPLVDGAPVKL